MTLSLSRTALILLAGTALTACTTMEPARPNFPARLDPPAPAPQSRPVTTPPPVVRDEAPMPEAPRATPPVQSAPLPSLTPARPAPAPYTPPPVTQTVTKTSVSGKVVTTAGPAKTYTVKKGDNLDAIARTLGTDRKALADLNNLKSPYALKPGQELKGPKSSSVKAYVVGSGDTLFAIARRFNVTAAAIAEANDSTVGAALSVGQQLVLPEGYRDSGPVVTRTQVTVPASSSSYEPPPRQEPARQEPTRQEPFRPAPPPPREEEPARATTRTLVTGKVIDTAGAPRTYTVKKGDNLDAIARDLDTTRKDLAEDNKLKAPYALQPGQKLKGPAVKAKAYVAGQGDTLALIARRFNVTQRALASANGLRAGAAIKPGRQVILPPGYRDRGPIREEVTTTPAPSRQPVTPTPAPYNPPPVSTPSTPQPYTPSPSTPRPSTPAPTLPVPSASPTDAQISSFGRGRFIWPLQGEIISDFGPKGTGQRNDGINVRTSTGEAVRAAAAGDVVYAGDQVPGFGNLVLIKHADGWVTAYGHLSRVDVKMQQKITQGQQIGQAGASGGVSEPQLHFEVRYAPTPQDRARPIDPKLVLPK